MIQVLGLSEKFDKSREWLSLNHTAATAEMLSMGIHIPGLCVTRDAMWEIPTENLECWVVIDEGNRCPSPWAVSDTVSSHLIRGKKPSPL